MQKLSQIGSLLKKIYRQYSSDVLDDLQSQGFLDLRPSFLEILMYLSDHSGSSIKVIGESCGLKKQTMTSHLNELEKRGYVIRKTNEKDRREQVVILTDYGEKFRYALQKVVEKQEARYLERVGEVELDRVLHTLENLHTKMSVKESSSEQQLLI
ncbi:MAG: MarR family winged helix-turn-helix transcriptional regulator [Bdellovibrionota bacterium]|nr:MarR family winged helix-turn-helix transcriptional regulator [Bdellovibrionota bacterium]